MHYRIQSILNDMVSFPLKTGRSVLSYSTPKTMAKYTVYFHNPIFIGDIAVKINDNVVWLKKLRPHDFDYCVRFTSFYERTFLSHVSAVADFTAKSQPYLDHYIEGAVVTLIQCFLKIWIHGKLYVKVENGNRVGKCRYSVIVLYRNPRNFKYCIGDISRYLISFNVVKKYNITLDIFDWCNVKVQYSLCHWKSPPKFEIEALFQLVMLYTDTQKKTHIIPTVFFRKHYYSLRQWERGSLRTFLGGSPTRCRDVLSV
ncbi:hypothetical protein AGLY_016736 [Aphis glycines]|uniref:Uncharacterized protein n=1 Tax=Aphis glycines TaxID=307491 RepID=A0A6G0SYY0_APHGL|nr:hypothetical protein AGLY_016736 [Aphis glycines]